MCLLRDTLNSSIRRGGALTVEMALCLPILITFLFGSYELARANLISHAVDAAAYEGARVGILHGTTQVKIESACAMILNSVGISDFTVTVSPPIINKSTPTVTVDVDVPFRGNTSVTWMFVSDPTFRGTCQLKREVF
jgi:Flp pilus assembly protein TadG